MKSKKGNSSSWKLKLCFQSLSTEGQILEIQICFWMTNHVKLPFWNPVWKTKVWKEVLLFPFLTGRGGGGKPFSSQESHFPAESGCTKFHVSSSYSYWDMSVQNRVVDWHRDTTISSAASLAEYKPDMDAYFLLSLSPSLRHPPLSAVLPLPVRPALPPSADGKWSLVMTGRH